MDDNNERLIELTNQIASDLMMAEGPETEEFASVVDKLDELISSCRVLTEIEESELLETVIEDLSEAKEFVEKIEESGDLESAETELTELFDRVETNLRDYTRGVSEEETGASVETTGEAAGSSGDSADEFDDLITDPDSYDEEMFFDFFSEATEHLQGFEDALLHLESDPSDTGAIDRSFRAIHSLKGMAGFMNFKLLNRLSHAMENLLDLFREGYVVDKDSGDLLLNSLDILKQIVNLHHKTVESGKEQSFDSEQFNQVYAQVKQTQKRVEAEGEMRAATDEEAAGGEAEEVQLEEGQQIKVDLEKIDSLVNSAGELVTVYNQLKQKLSTSVDREEQKVFNQMERIVDDLQEGSLDLRMVPLRKSFSRVRRMVRDLSEKFDKEINLEITGTETELDRTLVEKIQDPLVHLVRNALDHGIEPPEVRVEKEKPEAGQLEISAYHESGSVIIEISDDGAGIDPEAIFEKAVGEDIVEPGAELSKEEKLRLIFAPGFSTTEEVSDVSGRGVGMDVVRNNIEEINGQIKVDSELGEGSTFKLEIPLTLSIINGMLIRLGERRYVIPTLDIWQSLSPAPEQITTVENRGQVLNLRGDLIEIVDLNRVLDIGESKQNFEDSLLVIVEGMEGKIAVTVDELLGQQEVVIKSLGSSLEELPVISGASILGDGNVALIIDSHELSRVR